MAKKAATKKAVKEPVIEETNKETSFFDYLRFGESYTSLILGIIVVIIATALLLSFVHNKDVSTVNTSVTPQTQNTVQISQKTKTLAQKEPSSIVQTLAPSATLVPTNTIVPTEKPTVAPKPTVKPKPTQSVKKLAKAFPTPTARPKRMIVKKKIAKINHSPTHTPQFITGKDKNVWVVQKNESLWIIAEKKYSSGYNWVDIAKANNLADPSDIHVGDRLILPNVTPGPSTLALEKPTVETNDQQFSSTKRVDEIAGKTYTVKHGDTLWNIAVRAYGDGYKWSDIAKANNLTNPGLIFSGNVLSIPR